MKINSHRELEVYKMALEGTMKIFEITKTFPKSELYSLTDQIRRSSRSVCANLAEAFRKRKYPKHFISKLNDVQGEAAETQVWIEIAMQCEFIGPQLAKQLDEHYEKILKKTTQMTLHPESWSIE